MKALSKQKPCSRSAGTGSGKQRPYISTGAGLPASGIIVASISQLFIQLNWLSAMGIAMVIIALVLIALGRTIPRLSPETSAMLMETGTDNIASLLEELGISSKAVYLPPSSSNAKPQALIPLQEKPLNVKAIGSLPQRLIVNYGSGGEDIGLLVTTAGSVASQMLQTRPAASPSEYEAALASLLIGELGAAENVKVTADKYKVQVIIANPGINGRTNRADSCLGGPLAQITATLAAIAWNRPFIINKEERSPKRQLIELEVIA